MEKGGPTGEKPPWRADAEDAQDSKATKEIKERLSYWQKASRFAAHDDDKVLADAQVERLQKLLQEAKPLHVQQMSLNTRLAKAKDTVTTLEENLADATAEVEKQRALLDKKLADAQTALDEAKRQVEQLQQEASEAFAKSIAANEGEHILKMGEPQFASASQEFKDWFSKMREDQAGAQHLDTLRSMLEAQAIASKQAYKQPAPTDVGGGGIGVPVGGHDDDMDLDEDAERNIAEAGQALLEAKQAAAAASGQGEVDEAARKVAAAKRILREQMASAKAKKQRVQG